MSKLRAMTTTSRKITLGRETLINPHFGGFEGDSACGRAHTDRRFPLCHKGNRSVDDIVPGVHKRRFRVLAPAENGFLHSPSRTALITGMYGIRNGVVNHGGLAADLRPEGARREFIGTVAANSWASKFYWAGWHTASISSFPFRHSATWWNHGFMEAMNLMRGMGGERADEVLPGALAWLDRAGAADNWFLHLHLRYGPFCSGPGLSTRFIRCCKDTPM